MAEYRLVMERVQNTIRETDQMRTRLSTQALTIQHQETSLKDLEHRLDLTRQDLLHQTNHAATLARSLKTHALNAAHEQAAHTEKITTLTTQLAAAEQAQGKAGVAVVVHEATHLALRRQAQGHRIRAELCERRFRERNVVVVDQAAVIRDLQGINAALQDRLRGVLERIGELEAVGEARERKVERSHGVGARATLLLMRRLADEEEERERAEKGLKESEVVVQGLKGVIGGLKVENARLKWEVCGAVREHWVAISGLQGRAQAELREAWEEVRRLRWLVEGMVAEREGWWFVDGAEIDAAELDTAELDAAEVDAAEVDAAEVDAAEVDAAEVGDAEVGRAATDAAAIVAMEVVQAAEDAFNMMRRPSAPETSSRAPSQYVHAQAPPAHATTSDFSVIISTRPTRISAPDSHAEHIEDIAHYSRLTAQADHPTDLRAKAAPDTPAQHIEDLTVYSRDPLVQERCREETSGRERERAARDARGSYEWEDRLWEGDASDWWEDEDQDEDEECEDAMDEYVHV